MKRIITMSLVVSLVAAFFSPHYRKCKLNSTYANIGALEIEKVQVYGSGFPSVQRTKTILPLEYQELNFLYLEYVDAGGSGEVYRVEELNTSQIKILKRFFKQKPIEFQEENFIMNLMNYPIGWHHEDNNPQKPTLASYQSKESVVLRDVVIEHPEEYGILLYKICRELEKSHRNGIIHHDLKMGNILIYYTGEGFKSLEVQLIDWNLAAFYSLGYESSLKQGTPCYYSPEAMLRASFLTPATDIWSLAIVYFAFMTTKKPFIFNCKKSNLEAIASFVGNEKLLKMYDKYKLASSTDYSLIEQLKQNPRKYEEMSLRDRIPSSSKKIFDDELIDLFEKMLEVDPEYRITITEVMNHPYFDRLKRLPPMYKQKKRKQDDGSDFQADKIKAPANNLIPAKSPSEMNGQ